MGRRTRQKIKIILSKNRRKKNQEATVRWAELPQDILGLILGKLKSAVDVIRFRAVCKSWHIDYKDRRNLPWLCNFSWSKKQLKFLECEMYDPYSRQIFKTSKFVKSRGYTRCCSTSITCIGSNQGWLIAVYDNNLYEWEIFMYNPYSQHFISLPSILRRYRPRFATFSGNPVSCNDSRVFLFMTAVFPRDAHYIASYGLNGDKEWEIEYFDAGVDDEGFYRSKKDEGFYNECCGMQYMNKQLFCLFENGSMIRYNLADKSWTIIYLGEGSHKLATDDQQLWLAKSDGDLLVACELGDNPTECSTFNFDWSNMGWVGSDLKESSAIFISEEITTFVRPFEDKDGVENDKSCKVYFFDEADCKKEPSDYSFAEMRKHGKSSFSTVFMEPPRIN